MNQLSSDSNSPKNAAVKPIPAATIMLIRDGKNGLEVFMVVRHHQIDFASGALVFPGGKVTSADQEPDLVHYCNSAMHDQLFFGLAAIRETFEESGILLAREQSTQQIVTHQRLSELAHYRDKLANDEITLGKFLKTEKLIADTKSLTRFAHWVTPEFVPKRFDTMFYIVQTPKDQIGEHDGSESVDSIWINPNQALNDYQEGRRTLIFPTRMNVMKLSQFQTVTEAITQSRADCIKTILPWIEERKKGQVLCIPKDAGYDQTEESLENIFKMGG